MKINLYPCFENWKKYNNIYIISDTHFADEEMKYIRTNYISDEEQLKRINSKVTKNDCFICLGDIGDTSYIQKIRAGYKVLIMGNHEKGVSNYKRESIPVYHNGFTKETYTAYIQDMCKKRTKNFFGKDYDSLTDDEKASVHSAYHCFDNYSKKNVTFEDNNLFDEVYDGPVMINDRLILSHEPIDVPEYMFNIHGHDHSGSMFDEHHLNLCAELIDYTPLCLSNFIKKGGLAKISNIHRVTIDTATERKSNKKIIDHNI